MAASAICILLLIARRVLAFFGKGELGGPIGPKILSALILVILWLGYVLLSALQTYNYISVWDTYATFCPNVQITYQDVQRIQFCGVFKKFRSEQRWQIEITDYFVPETHK